MKLRLSGPSVRLRLSGDDIARLLSDGRVDAVLVVGGSAAGSWRYALVAAEAEALATRLDDEGLEIAFPAAELIDWAASDRVGLYGEVGWDEVGGDENKLVVKVEKDLGCDHEGGPPRRRRDK